jgi:hypothetical protein
MSPIAQALYFATLMHATGVIAGWHYRKWLCKKKLPKPLVGEPKVLYPPDDAPECLKEAFWSGCTSDYLDASEPRGRWANACIAYKKE